MDIVALNQRFGIAGRIAFREGLLGPIIVVASPNGVAEISVYGGQVLTYRAKGYVNALWLSPLAEFEEGKAIRGGIPVCWPWFGKAPASMPEGTVSHGFARRAMWAVCGSEADSSIASVTLGLTQEMATSPAWPYAYQLKLTVTVGDSLRLDLQTRNMDQVPFTYSEALHTYVRVGNAEEVKVYGLGAKPLAFTDDEAYDVIHAQADATVALQDPRMERVIGISGEDSQAMVVWHPALECGLLDVPLEGPRKFVCLEPANPHHEGFTPITLAPGKSRTLTMQVQPSRLTP